MFKILTLLQQKRDIRGSGSVGEGLIFLECLRGLPHLTTPTQQSKHLISALGLCDSLREM